VKAKLVFLGMILVLLAVPLSAACSSQAPKPSGPATLNLVATWAKGAVAGAPGEYWVNELNRRAKGEVTVNYKGGPEVIPTYDQQEAVIKGVIDIQHGPLNYFTGILPASHVLDVSPFLGDEQGPGTEIHNYLVEMWKEKGLRYLGEFTGSLDTGNFSVFTNKKVTKLEDLRGQKMRISPMAVQFAQATGIQAITMPLGDIYLGMERGTIDGYIMPIWASFNEMDLPKVTKYMIDIPIYRGNTGNAMNLASWEKLSANQQKLLLDTMVATMDWTRGFLDAEDKSQKARSKAAKMEFLKLSPEETQRYIKLSQDVIWAYYKEKLSAERYSKLRKLLKYD